MQNETDRQVDAIGRVLRRLELQRVGRIAKIASNDVDLNSAVLVVNCSTENDQYPPVKAVNGLVQQVFDPSVVVRKFEFLTGSCVINLGTGGMKISQQRWLPGAVNGRMLDNNIIINYSTRALEVKAISIRDYLHEDTSKIQDLELGELTPRIAWHLGVLVSSEDNSNIKIEDR